MGNCLRSCASLYSVRMRYTCEELLGLLTGIYTVLVLIYMIATLNLFPVVCPNDCSGHGICSPQGYCICTNPLYSGVACSDTLVYIDPVGNECSGTGRGNRQLTYASMAPQCVFVQPTLENSYQISGGWLTPECRAYQAMLFDKFTNRSITLTELAQLPFCMCDPGYDGLKCENVGCPVNVETDLVCNGRGNTSVSLMRNNTGVPGDGCRCVSPQFPLLYLHDFSPEIQARIATQDYQFYANGLCGTLYQNESNLDQTFVLYPEYACSCAELAKGDGCQFESCPATDGIPCSGRGHPAYGIGLEFNTTRSVTVPGAKNCTPICADNNVPCDDGRCVSHKSLCTTPTACIGGQVRCPDGSCVTVVPEGCLLGYVNGFVDDINSVRRLFPEPLPPVLTLESPLVWISVTKGSAGSLEIVYYGERTLITTEGVHGISFQQDYSQTVERRYRTVPGNVTVFLSGDFWRVQPVPWFYSAVQQQYPTLRIVNSVRTAIIDVEGSYVYLNASSDYGIAYYTNASIIIPGGSLVSRQICYDNLVACVWSTTTYKSFDGERILCRNNAGLLVSSFNFACNIANGSLTGVSTGAMFLSRLGNVDLAGNDWVLQQNGSRESVVEFIASPDAVITDVQIVQVDDLVVPCACSIIPKFQSQYNELWVTEAFRIPPSVVGQYFVGYVAQEGDSLLLRARVTRISDNQIFGIAKGMFAEALFINTKAINRTEFTTGVEIADVDVFPSVCPNGNATRVESLDIDVLTSCSCMSQGSTTECNCESVLPTVPGFKCTFPGVCESGYDSESVTAEFTAYMRTLLQTPCFLTRVTGDLDPQYAVNNGSGVYLIDFGNVSYPGWLDALAINGSCITGELFATSSIFQDVYEHVNVSITCNSYGTIIVPVYDAAFVYDKFYLVLPDNDTEVEVYWSPQGVPMVRLWPYAYIGNVPFTGLPYSTGRSPDGTWLGMDFMQPRHIADLFVNFQSVGVNGFDVATYVQVSNDTKKWLTISSYATNIENGAEPHLFMFADYFARYIRIFSWSPMVINTFVPLTDQKCDVGFLIPQPGYDPFILSTIDFFQNDLTKLNPDLPCVAVDACVIGNVTMNNNGVCNDELFLGWGRQWYEIFLPQQQLDRNQVISTCFGLNTTEAIFFTDGNYSIWWYDPNVTLPSNYTSWTVFTWLTVEDTNFCYLINNPTASADAQGTLTSFEPETGFVGLQQGTYCSNGTDWTDCGPSNRIVRSAPGLACALTPEQQDLQDDLVNRTDFFTSESRTIEQFLSGPTPVLFRHTFTFERHVVQMSRRQCDSCDGLYRCIDGTCVNNPSKCVQALYNCPGNGCLRYDINIDDYTCACDVGVSGYTCSVTKCVPGDPETGLVPPDQICSVGLPPLRSKPPISVIVQRGRPTIQQVFLLNDNTGSQVVADINIRPEFAPYGAVRPYWITKGNLTFRTQCPPAAKDPLGRPVLLQDCVKSRDIDGNPTEWVQFETLGGGTTQIVWNTPYQYTDFSYRCSDNGWCVSNPAQCPLYDKIRKPCNGNGDLMADGTCKCNRGFMTFVITEEFSRSVRVPYFVRSDGITNPTVWGVQNKNSYYWWSQQCMAKNCDEIDCSPPLGCFVGTPQNAYKDRLIPCPGTNVCAIDTQACDQGQTSPKIVCSGNGIARKRDYREDEWYCECGVLEGENIVKNGWGGENCGLYLCDDASTIWWEPFNYVDDDYWRTPANEPLPGKWMGPCGAAVGPDPDEHEATKACCAGYERLEFCPKVRCQIRDTIVCIPSEDCIGDDRKPLVYSVNRKGKVLADGTVECEFDPATGIGYEADRQQFPSQDGCYRLFTCPLAQQRNTPCNRITPGEDWNTCIMPPIPYFDQQWATFASISGLPPTNRTFVLQLVQDLSTLEELKEQAYVKLALDVIAAKQALGACVCVLPGPDTSCCMIDGSDYTYSQPFSAAYYIPSQFSILTNNEWYTSTFAVDGVDYVQTPIYNADLTNVNSYSAIFGGLTVNFSSGDAYAVSGLRMFAQNTVQGTSIQIWLAFYGSDGEKICSDQPFPWSTVPRFVSDASIVYCVTQYVPYPFETAQTAGWLQNCQAGNIIQCTAWKLAACPAVRVPPNSLSFFIGCQNEVCCIPTTAAFGNTRWVTVVPYAKSGNLPQETNATFGEIEPYGFVPNTIVAMPPILQSTTNATTGADYLYFKFKLGDNRDGSYYVFTNAQQLVVNSNYQQAYGLCLSSGGVFATARANDPGSVQGMGVACIEQNTLFPSINPANENAKCIVAAKNRDSATVVPIQTVINTQGSAFGCWISTDSGLDPLVPAPVVRTSQIDVYSSPNEGVQYQTIWASGQVPWATYLATSYNLGQKQIYTSLETPNMRANPRSMQTAGNILYYSDKYIQPLNTVTGLFTGIIPYGWNPLDGSRQAATLIDQPVTPFPNPSNQCGGAFYCQFQTRIAHVVDAQTSKVTFVKETVNVGEAAVTEYFLVDKVCKLIVYTRPAAGRCLGLCGMHVNGRSDAAMAMRSFTAANFYEGANVRLSGLFAQDEVFDMCVDGRTQCNDLGTRIVGNIDSFAIEGDCTVHVKSAILNQNNDAIVYNPPATAFIEIDNRVAWQRVNGSFYEQQQYVGYRPFGETPDSNPEDTWYWNRQNPYGLYGNCFNGDRTAACPVRPLILTGNYFNQFFGGETDQWYPGGYPGVYSSSYPAYGSVPNPSRQYMNLRVVPNFPIVKIRTSIRAQRTASGSSQGQFPNYVMGWETHPFMCANVKVEWIPYYASQNAGFNNPRTIFSDFAPYIYFEGEPVLLAEYNTPSSITRSGVYTIDDFVVTTCPANRVVRRSRANVNDPWTYACSTDAQDLNIGTGNRMMYPPVAVSVALRTGQPSLLTTCSQLNRPVRRCIDCLQVIPANFQWGATYFDPSNLIFPVQTDDLFKDFLDIYVQDATVPFKDYAVTNINYFANRIAVWTTADYEREFWLDNCLYIGRYTERPGSSFALFPFPCKNALYPALCTLDTVRYVAVDGTTCDVYGPSARRGGAPTPNVTCFDLFPEANPELNPVGFAVLEAYEQGTLSNYIAQQNYDYDAIAAFIQNDTQSFIAAWPQFDVALIQQFSDRINYLSRGALANSVSWRDVAVFNHYPFDCGPVTDPTTGITWPIWALSAEHCTFADTKGGEPLTDYPTILDPLEASVDPTTQPVCGISVYLASYGVFNGFGDASTISTMVLIGSTATNAVELEAPLLTANETSAMWINTGKNEAQFKFVANLSVTITGSLTCVACTMTLYLTPLNPSYGPPEIVLFVGNVTGTRAFKFNVTAPNDGNLYQIIGLNFSDTVPSEIVTVSRLILTTAESIAVCRRGYPDRFRWVEAPLAMVSCNQQNICVSNKKLQKQYDAKAVGTCVCTGTAWGGATCECPALDTRTGTQVCGGWGASNAVTDGIVTDTQGCYQVNNQFGCTCRDVGSAFRTRRLINTAFNYEYAVLNDLVPNRDLFVLAPQVSNILYVLDEVSAVSTCGSVSASISSWYNADLAELYVETVNTEASTPQYAGLALLDGVLTWNTFDIQFSFLPPQTSNVPQSVFYLNWNNFVFVAGSANVLINGLYNASISITTAQVLTLTRPSVFKRGVTVVIYTSTTSTRGKIVTCSVSTPLGPCFANARSEFDCDDGLNAYDPVSVSVSGSGSCVGVTEVAVFDGVGNTNDRGRNPYF